MWKVLEAPRRSSSSAIPPLISAGILISNWLSVGSEIALLEQIGVKLLHLDVMDGCFCPMMTVGPPIITALKTSLLKDVHFND